MFDKIKAAVFGNLGTTVAGLGAGGVLLWEAFNADPIDWKMVVVGALIALGGILARQFNVSSEKSGAA